MEILRKGVAMLAKQSKLCDYGYATQAITRSPQDVKIRQANGAVFLRG
jgi:hypothetical protein